MAVKNKREYFLGAPTKPCVICRTPTSTMVMLRTNNIEYYEGAKLDPSTLDMDKILRFVKAMKAFQTSDDPLLNDYRGRWAASKVDDGKVEVDIQYDYKNRTHKGRVIWSGEKFNLPYGQHDLFGVQSLWSLKTDKAILKGILKRVEEHNKSKERAGNKDFDQPRDYCCSEVCLNMWILER